VNSAQPARVVVVDGNPSLAGILGELLADEPGFTVVGTATTGDRAVQLARECEADVFLVDERVDQVLRTTVLDALRAACPEALVLLWSHHEVHTAAEGVDAVLPRGMTFRELVRALRVELRKRPAPPVRSIDLTVRPSAEAGRRGAATRQLERATGIEPA
jgi:DNA-binding NarL/FixJ family response regulator